MVIAAEDRAATEAEEPPLLTAGDVVGGRYVLSKILGRGAAGTVWEAEHRLLTSRVAVKFLDTAALLDPTSAEILAQRFRFEAQISARLAGSTKHMVAAHDAGMFRGVPYLVMELVDGETLDARLSRSHLSVTEVADMLDQIAEPIDGAHRVGIAHRDVKPGNIMIVTTLNGPLYKLGDFGTAKAFGEGLVGLTPPKQTSENTLVGSPAYMSPEYISGLPLTDGVIDVWALTVTAYESLTGRLPFDGDVWTQVAVAIVGGEFPAPSTLVEDIPKKLDDVFARAFSQEPGVRFTNARHFARAFRQSLETSVAPRAVGIDSVDAVVIPPAPSRRLWGYGAISLVAFCVVGLAFVLATRAPAVPAASTAAANTANVGKETQTAESRGSPQPIVAATHADATQTAEASAPSTAPMAVTSAAPTGRNHPVSTASTASSASAEASASEPPRPRPVATTPRTKPTVNPSEIH